MNKMAMETVIKCPLFAKSDPAKLPSLLKKANAYKESFSSGEPIPFRVNNCGRVGIVLSGSVKVYSSQDKKTLLNLLTGGSLFGVSSLYSQASADTFLFPHGETSVLFIDEKDLDPLWEDRNVRGALVAFLAGRIRFLSKKIASFTAPSAEKSLARFLVQNADSEGCVSGFRSYASLARSLNLGRASLYRALEKLESDGLIDREGKRIRILSLSHLAEFK